jgi:hypothetical protein
MALNGYTAKVIDGVVHYFDAAGNEVSKAALPTAVASTAEFIAETNRRALLSKASSALLANATYLAIGSPTSAQNTAQIRALTRQVTALIRLTTRALDTQDGT